MLANPVEMVFYWMNLESAGEQLYSSKPDSCEIHPTPHRGRFVGKFQTESYKKEYSIFKHEPT